MNEIMNNLNENTILAFHIGRGGRFNNAGYYTFLGQHSIGEFLDGLYPPTIVDESNPDEPQLIDDDSLEAKWTSESGHSVGLTNAQVKAGIGRIDEDGEYDTTYTVYLKDIEQDSKEWDAIFRADSFDAKEVQAYLNEQFGID